MSSVRIIGILNATPDSFYAGSRIPDIDAALVMAKRMILEGADILEVGGESTGPHSVDVSAEEEMARVLPIIQALHAHFPQITLAVDTYKAKIAREAIEAGASLVNDVTAGRADPAMFGVVAASHASMVLMHAKDQTPRTTIQDVVYNDVVSTVRTFLQQKIEAAIAAGIPRECIIIDPGLGHFISADPQYSLELIARLAELTVLGCPILLSPSRKSFLAGPANLPAADRLPATLAASAVAVLHGATYIRTHDVAEVRRACDIAQAIRTASRQST